MRQHCTQPPHHTTSRHLTTPHCPDSLNFPADERLGAASPVHANAISSHNAVARAVSVCRHDSGEPSFMGACLPMPSTVSSFLFVAHIMASTMVLKNKKVLQGVSDVQREKKGRSGTEKLMMLNACTVCFRR